MANERIGIDWLASNLKYRKYNQTNLCFTFYIFFYNYFGHFFKMSMAIFLIHVTKVIPGTSM